MDALIPRGRGSRWRTGIFKRISGYTYRERPRSGSPAEQISLILYIDVFEFCNGFDLSMNAANAKNAAKVA